MLFVFFVDVLVLGASGELAVFALLRVLGLFVSRLLGFHALFHALGLLFGGLFLVVRHFLVVHVVVFGLRFFLFLHVVGEVVARETDHIEHGIEPLRIQRAVLRILWIEVSIDRSVDPFRQDRTLGFEVLRVDIAKTPGQIDLRIHRELRTQECSQHAISDSAKRRQFGFLNHGLLLDDRVNGVVCALSQK